MQKAMYPLHEEHLSDLWKGRGILHPLTFFVAIQNDTQLCLGIRRRQTSTDVVRTMKLSMAGVSEAPKSIDAVEERLDLWLLSLAT